MSRDDDKPDASPAGGEQLALIRETVREAKKPRAKPRTWRGAPRAERLPVARVLVDKGLSHLDRYFDYAVPAAMDEEAQPGVRVRVRFGARVVKGRREGGELHDGFIVERAEASDYAGPLAPLAQVLSTERVLTPRLLDLCRAVADRYAGSLADVVQLAVPPRRARVEQQPPARPFAPPLPLTGPGPWGRYETGPGFLHALARRDSPRAVWTALPGPSWPQELAYAAAAALSSGRGALIVVPDGRAAARVDEALTALIGAGRHVLLAAETGPEERYRRWLAVSRGSVRAVVGTRAAVFAPVQDLGLVALWDDGDSSHSEQHAPQPHAREVLLLRAAHERTGFLIGGHSVTVDAAQLLQTGWARPLTASREQVRAAAPLIRTVGETEEARDAAARAARLPSLAWQAVRDGLRSGPVLVQVPRRGYAPRLACERCRAPARCGTCSGPLESRGPEQPPHCAWCAREEADWHCPECGASRLRAQVIGARRTAEELGRAFPAVQVRTSGRDHVLDRVPDLPALVVCTPGAEPVADGGYAAALLLDGWALLGRPDLHAGEEALRRWLGAASLVRPQSAGGTVVVVADPAQRPVQALVRWDPAGFAARELADRAELGFPPVSRMASVAGPGSAVTEFLLGAGLPADTDVLGPVPVPAPGPAGRPRRPGDPAPAPAGDEPWERVLLRVPRGTGAALAAALKAAQAARMVRRETAPVRVRIDPSDIG
ncbi:putative primosomal protein N' [Streptomyces sp. RB5]|uniref:Probable replication restart protein PriA n=1 Tax=Streptomyces smaragdinus TaxID=2585196 RepID=A0A7K0CEH7_9ACTN|nr:primosomal protein N' [Streptomyces smaragdinus]MQY11878.1 putative primosomal protein N' [Streptomyces smaragdinus]